VTVSFGSIALRRGVIFMTQFVGPSEQGSDERRCLQLDFAGSNGEMTLDEVRTLIAMLQAWERTIR